MSRWKFLSLVTYHLSLVTFFTVYSYTQVDLNLTLSSNPTYQSIQYQLTQLGYFNRPLSTAIFFSILASLSIFYLLFSIFSEKWPVTLSQVWSLIIGTSLILTASYPAFAHDVFNYMFDARTIVKYGQNPYFTTPLDFPQDDWTRFMRWTHVGSAYPPGWLITTIPFYLLGLGKFTLTLLSFKLLGLISFLTSSWLMLKIAGRRAWILWSFNPMVIIESTSSVHNDAVMTTFALLAFYLANRKQGLSSKDSPWRRVLKRVSPYFIIIWGGLIKYSSILLIPFLKKPIYAAAAAWIGAVTFFFIREINPWYILLPVAVSFMSKNKYLTYLSLASSIIVMYRYYPCVAIFSC
ncbi:MAG: polyprenol phosphomannose-dependent alpha 1,6 mannosyltransferase MptB [Parcubacteria group bacterium]|nr:polyprenol phosphomannose-dependent alpha 1,6 mannosyltransferase MptB [Parcubacteria group bacterium]